MANKSGKCAKFISAVRGILCSSEFNLLQVALTNSQVQRLNWISPGIRRQAANFALLRNTAMLL